MSKILSSLIIYLIELEISRQFLGKLENVNWGKPLTEHNRYAAVMLLSDVRLRIPVMAIGYSSRRRSLIPVIAIMAGRRSKAGHDGSAARRRWRKQRLQD